MSFNDFKSMIKILFSHPASIIVVSGKMNTGKTDFALYLTENILNIGYISKVGSNIRVKDDRFERITSVEGLKKWIEKDRKVRKLFVLDECGEHIDTRNPLSRMNKELRYLGFKIRKYRGKMILIIQRLEDLESTFRSREITLAIFKKLSKKRCMVYSDLLREKDYGDAVELKNIPRTSIKFNTYDIAPFFLEEDVLLSGRDKCCVVAKRYAECGNFSIIAKEMDLKPMQIKRLLQDHVKHSLKG